MNEVVVVVVVGCDSSWRYCYIHTNFLLSCCTLHSPAALWRWYIAVSMVNDSTSALLVKYHGVSGYHVCSDHWTSTFSDAVCQQLGNTLVYLHFYYHDLDTLAESAQHDLFRHSRHSAHCLNHLYTTNLKPPGAMRLRQRGHDFELPTVKYEFNKRNFIVRFLFQYVWLCLVVLWFFKFFFLLRFIAWF